MAKQKLAWLEAHVLASIVIDHLRPHCDRIEIAGSIRRKCAEVGDIEIVAIPKREPATDMFGNETGFRYPIDDALGAIADHIDKDGEKYKQFNHQSRQVDLFLTTAEQWGVIFAIRTGPADFSRKLVTQKSKGGYLIDNCQVRDGWLKIWKDDPGVFLSQATFSEEAFFAHTTLKIPPAPEKRA